MCVVLAILLFEFLKLINYPQLARSMEMRWVSAWVSAEQGNVGWKDPSRWDIYTGIWWLAGRAAVKVQIKSCQMCPPPPDYTESPWSIFFVQGRTAWRRTLVAIMQGKGLPAILGKNVVRLGCVSRASSPRNPLWCLPALGEKGESFAWTPGKKERRNLTLKFKDFRTSMKSSCLFSIQRAQGPRRALLMLACSHGKPSNYLLKLMRTHLLVNHSFPSLQRYPCICWQRLKLNHSYQNSS